MKFFFQYIVKIIIITFVIAFGVQWFIDNGLRNLKNTQINDWKNILDGKVNSEIIINGSSRGFVGYSSEIIGKKLNSTCFNLSFNAGGYNLQQDKFDIYIKRNKKPKIVIQNIDLAHFSANKTIPEESQFFPFVYNQDVNSFVEKFENKFTLFKLIPLLKYNQNFSMIKEGLVSNFLNLTKKNATTFKGFCPQDRVFKIDYHNLKKQPLINLKVINDKEIIILHQMVDFYNLKLGTDSKLIFVWLPENNMRLNKAFALRREKIVDELNLIQKKHKNFIFIDMAYDEISSHNEYYYDTFHLNETGSNVFSKKISEKIYEQLK